MSSALLFGVLAGLLGQLIELVMFRILGDFLFERYGVELPDASARLTAWSLEGLPDWVQSFLGFQLLLLAAPVIAVVIAIAIFVLSAALHVVLSIVGGLRSSQAGFGGTVRVVCYAMAIFPLQILPFFGDLLVMAWASVVAAIGLRELHGCKRWQAWTAALSPFALLLSFLALFLAIAFL